MAGTSAVPNVFTTQVGQVPASQLDSNWNALTAYINVREVDSGTLAARPVGTDGQWYFATDVNGGTLFFNSIGFWVQAAPAAGSGVIVPVRVDQGGTGSTAWQATGVLTGSGTGNVLALVPLAPTGALLVGQTNATPSTVAAGANSTILTADSTVAAGLRYAPGPKARLHFNAAGAQTAGQTLFWGSWAADTPETAAYIQHILPFDCWVRNLFAKLTTAPAGTQDVKLTVRLNQVSTTLTATITGTADRAANSATIIAAKAGDLLTIQVTFSAAAASSTGTGVLELNPR